MALKKITRSHSKVVQDIGRFTQQQKRQHKLLPIEKIDFDPTNIRTKTLLFTPADLPFDIENCADSNKKKQYQELLAFGNEILEDGLINPISVEPKNNRFFLTAGHRRTISLLIAMLEKNTPAEDRVISALIDIEPQNEYKIARKQWNENDKRLNLVLSESLDAIEKLIKKHPDFTSDTIITTKLLQEVANVGETQARQYAKVLNCQNEILRKEINKGNIKSLEKAYFIANLDNVNEASTAIAAIKEGDNLTSVKQKIEATKPTPEETRLINVISSTKQPQGRPSKFVNFGKTTKTDTALFVINALLDTNKLASKRESFMQNINTEDMKSLTKTLKNIISYIEADE